MTANMIYFVFLTLRLQMDCHSKMSELHYVEHMLILNLWNSVCETGVYNLWTLVGLNNLLYIFLN